MVAGFMEGSQCEYLHELLDLFHDSLEMYSCGKNQRLLQTVLLVHLDQKTVKETYFLGVTELVQFTRYLIQFIIS